MDQERFDSLIVEWEGTIGYLCDFETYDMLHLTKAGMDLYGLKAREDYLGRKCYKLLQGYDRPCPFCTNDKLVEGESYSWERLNEKLGRWMEIEDTLVEVNGRKCRLELARDITDQRERLNRLADQLSVEDIVVTCLRTLSQEPDMDVALNTFLKTVGSFYRAHRSYIFEFNVEAGTADNTFEWCAPLVSSEIENLQGIPISVVADWVAKFKEQGEFFITSLSEDRDRSEDERRILEAQGIESLLAAPLVEDGEIIGFLGVDDPEEHSDDLTLLRATSDFVLEELKKRRLTMELEHASYTDLLTGLKNRNQYIKELEGYAQGKPRPLGVIFVDVNGMKGINDTYGHAYGDAVIVRTADILKGHVAGDVFRIGGDEFIALLPNVGEDEFLQEVELLRAAFQADEECDVSIGCVWDKDSSNIERHILHADELMYAEKQSYYQTVLTSGRTRRLGLADEVLKEVTDGRFVVFYQPQYAIKSGEVVGAEALVRKKGPDGQLILPDSFIPLYETEGVIRHVDLFVLEEVCDALKLWSAKGVDLRIAVNFSRITLMEPGIVDTLRDVCAAHGVLPERIGVEVTESASKMDHRQLEKLVSNLMEVGFTVSLDGFGSKYSNLSILAAMDFDEVKFDRSLVSGLEESDRSRIVMRNGLRMCQDMENVSSYASGVETAGQLELLENYACDFGQGFFFAEPMTREELDSLIDGQARKAAPAR